MVGLVVGLLLGSGLFLIWWSCWPVTEPRRRRQSARRERAQDVLTQAGVGSVTPRSLALTCVGVGVAVGLLGFAVSGAAAVASCFAVMAAYGPVALVRFRARARQRHLRELWPEVVDNLSSAVRAGLSLPEALSQLAERGPQELRPAFEAFAQDYRATGRFTPCLDALKERLADPVADRLVEALRITREVGGSDLGRLLRTLSGFLRQDQNTRAELEARQSWTVNAARLAVAAPWIVLALLSTRAETAQAYDTGTGVAILAGGGVLTVVAYRIMVRIGRLPEEQRVLR